MSLREVLDYIYELKKEIKKLKEKVSSLETQLSHLASEQTQTAGGLEHLKKETHRSLRLLEDWVADLDRRVMRLESRARRRLERREASDKPQ